MLYPVFLLLHSVVLSPIMQWSLPLGSNHHHILLCFVLFSSVTFPSFSSTLLLSVSKNGTVQNSFVGNPNIIPNSLPTTSFNSSKALHRYLLIIWKMQIQDSSLTTFGIISSIPIEFNALKYLHNWRRCDLKDGELDLFLDNSYVNVELFFWTQTWSLNTSSLVVVVFLTAWNALRLNLDKKEETVDTNYKRVPRLKKTLWVFTWLMWMERKNKIGKVFQ